MKKKIMLVCTVNLEDNGIANFVVQSAKALAYLENDVTVVAINEVNFKKKDELIKSGVRLIESLNRHNFINYFFKLKEIIQRNKYDIVHVHGNSNTMALELLAAQCAGCKIRIAHSHNTTTNYMLLHKLLKPFFEEAVVERFACGIDAGKWIYVNKKFFVINNGINLNEYSFNLLRRKMIRKELEIKNDDILLGNIGVFNHQKNQKFLIDVMALLDDKYKLVYLGDGELIKGVKDYAKRKKVADRIIFKGNVDNVSEYLSAMDVFLLPSYFEGLPFSLIEAKASGLPCVVSDKVSSEANLASEISFLDISKAELWQSKIENIDVKEDREVASRIAVDELRSNGYDFNDTIEKLNSIYDDLVVSTP